MWFTIVSIFYVLICVFLILVVLLQQGKGGGMGSAFGGSTQTVFGGAGAGNFLTRLTAIAASLFMILSALLAYLSSSGDRAMRTVEDVEHEEAAEHGDAVEGAGTGEEAPPPPVDLNPPSQDTPDEAAQDPDINALEHAVEPAQEAPAEEHPEAEAPAEEHPEAEAPPPAEPEPAAEEPRAPAKVRAPRPPRPARPARPPAEEPAGEQPPAAEQPPAP